jgi:predicted PurR-regulated permease PerM
MADSSPRRGPFAYLIAAALVGLFLLVLWQAFDLLLLLFIAVLFAVYLAAVTDVFQKRLHLPRPLGIALGLGATLFGFGLVGVLLIPPLLEQVSALLSSLPARLMVWESSLVRFAERYPLVGDLIVVPEDGRSYFATLFGEIGRYFNDVFPYLFSGLYFLIHAFAVLAMSIFLAARPALYRTEILYLVPPANRELAVQIMDEISVTLRHWLGGQLVAMAVLGVFTWIGLELLNVPYALAFGVFTGLAAIVPFFGSLFSTLLPALYVLPTTGLLHALAVVLLGVVVHVVEANVVAPKVFEHQVRLPPVWTLLSVLVALKLVGPIGMIVAVPILAVIRVLVKRLYVDRYLGGTEAGPVTTDAPVPDRL